MISKQIICNICEQSVDKEDAQRICSNCFACTGCERYICPYCNTPIIISDVKKIGDKSSSKNQ